MIWLFLGIGSTIGSLIGSALDHGNFLGFWSVILGTIGGLVGIWLGYRFNNS